MVWKVASMRKKNSRKILLCILIDGESGNKVHLYSHTKKIRNSKSLMSLHSRSRYDSNVSVSFHTISLKQFKEKLMN